ncbi:MAG: diacylglycerol/lipid kinase family protein [bacterium]
MPENQPILNMFLIYNPAAAHGRAKKMLPLITLLFKQKNINVEVHLTQYVRHAIEMVKAADFSQYSGIVAAGGDGTLFEVINGYFQNVSNSRIPIGVIPIGTGNSFAKDLDLESGECAKAVEIISQNRPGKVDVGYYHTNGEDYYFLNILGVGFVTEVMKTAIKLKLLGNLCYTLGVFYQTLFLKTNLLTIEMDGQTVERETLMIEISNTRYTGRNFLMAPEAKFDDGFMDVILVKKLTRTRLLRLFPKLFSGTHITADEVETFKVKKIRINAVAPLMLGPDGELLGCTPLQVECLHQAVEFFT